MDLVGLMGQICGDLHLQAFTQMEKHNSAAAAAASSYVCLAPGVKTPDCRCLRCSDLCVGYD